MKNIYHTFYKTKLSSDKTSQPRRRLVQYLFLFILVLIGAQFTLWVTQLQNGQTPIVSRPPGVEGFLPISALISLKYWLLTGVFNTVHPSALVILLIVMLLAVVLKKAFCSWVCPFGLLSEVLAKLQLRIFDRPLTLPRWLDWPLRSLKYLLLFFFVWAIFVGMDVPALEKFINSPYNRVADIKMYLFFAHPSKLTLYVLAALLLMTLLVRHFWCRYLCPYGAMLGVLSLFSVFKVRRHAESCIDCEKCTKVCPARINVHKVKSVYSDECNACMRCVDACPVKDTLYFAAPGGKIRLNKWLPVIIVLLFLGGSLLARGLGVWNNSISISEYKAHIRHLDSPQYQHARGQVPDYER